MTKPKEALEWYERKRVEARAMADRDCNNCKHQKAYGCSRWECEYEPVMSDSISRQDAIRWVKTECNPYGKPTLDFESGKKVIEHLKQMTSADAVEVIRCKDCKHWYSDADTGMACEFTNMSQPEDGYCNWGERKGGNSE